MAEIKIKKATIKDLDLMVAWRMEVLHEVFAVPKTDAMDVLQKANLKYYERELSCKGHIACFACDDDEIVGCGGICIYDEMPSPDNLSGKCGYLMNIYTRKAFRCQGIGTKVVKWLIKEARALGITKIFLESSKDAKSLYQELGFKSKPDYMQL